MNYTFLRFFKKTIVLLLKFFFTLLWLVYFVLWSIFTVYFLTLVKYNYCNFFWGIKKA